MSRAQEIIDLMEANFVYKVGKGHHYSPLVQLKQATPGLTTSVAGIGAYRGGQAVHRLMRAHTDKIRQAGLGDQYDAAKRQHKIDKAQAKQDYKDGALDRSGRKEAIERSRANIDKVADAGHDKFKKMMKGTTYVQRQAVTGTM